LLDGGTNGLNRSGSKGLSTQMDALLAPSIISADKSKQTELFIDSKGWSDKGEFGPSWFEFPPVYLGG